MTQHLIHNQQKLPRAKSLRSNKILRISMIVDPRFAFDENILLKDEWIEVENELIDFYRNAAEVSDDLMIETSWTSLAIKTRAMRKNVELANFQSIEKPDPNECDPSASIAGHSRYFGLVRTSILESGFAMMNDLYFFYLAKMVIVFILMLSSTTLEAQRLVNILAENSMTPRNQKPIFGVAIYKGKYDELNSESCKRKVIEISRANCEILKQLNDQKFSIYESLNLLKAAFNWGENEEAKIIFLNNVHHELAINFEYNQRKDIYDRVEDLLSDWVDDWTLPYHEILQLSKESYLKKNAEFMLKGFAWRAFAFSFHSSTENQFWPGESWVLFFVLLVGSVDRAAPQAPGRHTAAAREPVETERLVFTQIMGENHASLKESTPIARRQLSFI
uniref:HAT C-terminal dimerisation domain-containing protein n=1 Tax=Globodera rostochiensis TaxID=31243 RepID=A0A914H6B4_GLORO